jgi:hypothetical protein
MPQSAAYYGDVNYPEVEPLGSRGIDKKAEDGRNARTAW